MANLVWDDELLVGVEEIDAQHRMLFGFANELQIKLRAGEGDQQITAAIRKLVDYVQTHFTAEEQYMTQLKYPGLAEQQLQHRGYTEKIASFIKRSQTDKTLLARDILLFLRTWYVSHISTTDRKLGEFVKQQKREDTPSSPESAIDCSE